MDTVLAHQKVRATLMHIGWSILVLLPVLVLIFWFWFPAPWYTVQGVLPIVCLMAALHLIMAPLLTGIVYKKGKKGMLLDLVVIGALQLGALAYGTVMIHSERPSFLVFAVDRFVSVANKDVGAMTGSRAGFFGMLSRGPDYQFAQLPMGEALQQFQSDVLFGGAPDLEHRPEYWLSFEVGAESVWNTARPLTELIERQPTHEAALREWVRQWDLEPESARVIPLVGKKEDFTALIDPETSQVLDVYAIYPWRN